MPKSTTGPTMNRMSAKLALATIVLLSLVACAKQRAFSGSALETRRMELASKVALHDVVLNPGRKESPDAILRNAAFEMVKGKSAEDAVAVFSADGATCRERTCIWSELAREPLYVLYVPSIRPPGPRREWTLFREVTLRSSDVNSPEDIAVETWVSAVVRSN